MMLSFQTFPVSAGLLDPRHVQAIGGALWVYLWFLNRVTKDEHRGEDFVGIVLNGRPTSIREIADELGMKERACRRHLARLVKRGYVLQKQTSVGTCTYTVTKSKKWAWKRQARTDRTHPSKALESQASLFFPDQDGLHVAPHQKVVSGSPSPHQILVRPDQKAVSAEGGTRARSQKPQRSKAHRGEWAESETVESRSCESEQPPSLTEHQNLNPQACESRVPELARKVIQFIAKTNTVANRKLIEAAIVAEAAHCGYSPEDAARAIAQNALDDGRRGVPIDRWYFEDTKWRNRSKSSAPAPRPVYGEAGKEMQRQQAAR